MDQPPRNDHQQQQELTHECKQLLLSLPREKGWRTPHLYYYQNFWCQPNEIQAIISCQRHFQAQDTDVVLATIPKSGTTWLKALAFATVHQFPPASTNHPLLTCNPHDLVPFFEYKLYANGHRDPDLSGLPQPRLFGTHVPVGSLPATVGQSNGCRVVYLCRNPLDNFVSAWHFLLKALGPLSMEEAWDMFCKGIIGFGPYWYHMLGYWKESKERTNKVLFLKYEDMKGETSHYVRKLADFLGYPFTLEEEKDGVVEEISKLCSFQKMKELEVNKTGKSILNFENKSLFRKGEVGDWVNYLTPEMVERLAKVMEDKLGGSGLAFDVFSQDKK